MTDPLYRGEAILLNWSDAKSGRKIVLQLEKDGPGAHPFDGLDGERFAVVIVGPLANTEHGQVAGREAGKAGAVTAGGSATHAPTDTVKVPATKPKRHWRDMPPSQRAALRVQEPEFWKYINEARGVPCPDEQAADAWLKFILDVDSKSKITGPVAHHFDLIDGKFQAWQQAKGHHQL